MQDILLRHHVSGAPLTLGGKTISSGGGGTLANCLAFSRNAATWHLMATIGVSRTIEFAKQCGIKATLPPLSFDSPGYCRYSDVADATGLYYVP